MTGRLGKATNSWADGVGSVAQNERDDMWGPMPGVVVSYDAAKQTANVRPLIKKKKWDGSDLGLPELQEVPIDFASSGSGAITQPVPVGTRVVLTPQMRSMENYDAEDAGNLSDSRSFNLSDVRASLTGGNSASKPLKDVDPDNTHIRADADGKYGVRLSPDGKIKIEGAQGNVYELIAEFMELVAGDQLQIAYGSSAGTGHALQNKTQLLAIAAKIRGMAL